MTKIMEAVSPDQEVRNRIIVALDVETRDQALEIAHELDGRVGAFKIGLQLFTSAGPGVVREIADVGNKVFLEWNGTAYSEPTATGSKRGTFNGATKIVGGTGKFAKIRGVLTDAVEFDTDTQKGYSRAAHRGEYWFEE